MIIVYALIFALEFNYVLPFHMERATNTSLYSGEYFVSADVSRTLKSIQQSVSDIRALINYIKTVKIELKEVF